MLNPSFEGSAKIHDVPIWCNGRGRRSTSCTFAAFNRIMSWNSSSIVAVGTVAFDSIKTPFGERERIVGGAGTY